MMMSDNEKSGLGSAFGSKTKGSQITYGHPYGKELVESAYNVIRNSELGRKLLKLIDLDKVPVHVIKGTGESGFSPELMTIYMQAPGKLKEANPAFIVNLVKALDEAAQELAGFKTPDPRKDIMAYASFIHGRNLDSITEVCRVIKELTSSGEFTNLLDSLTELGLNGVYKAYMAGKSRDELYEEYILAYDAARGR
jgi:hypothetical protein